MPPAPDHIKGKGRLLDALLNAVVVPEGTTNGRFPVLCLPELAAVVQGVARRLPEEELGRWLREKGLHEAQLKRWEQEIEVALAAQEERPAREREHERQLKELEREVRRKDKALAEMSALIVLKKELETMWEREEREP